ncbi:MAG: bifunctional oligoribonuclease/PAP phosphatase NrnA [Deltaproteobacteria bacterium]|nr:bifunctional oligoribonuclease/PAP phosphatase NrnA [Deltaproteobacteria bacterium]
MISKIIERIHHHGNFLLTSHVRLDGDALGSELALYHVLTAMGKKVTIYNEDTTPERYRFLPGSRVIVHEWPNTTEMDVVFVLDCSTLKRIGKEAHRLAEMKHIISIDHHIESGGGGGLTFRDEHVSSTGEMLYRLFEQMDIRLSKEAATNLYAAILTDTGGFRYGNTKEATLFAAGRLVERGADPQWISENIYDNEPLAKIRLLAKVLETLSFDLDDKVASIIVDRRILEATGALAEHSEGFVEFPRSIRGVQISILYNELAENQFKLSMRSKEKINVEKIARAYGGGGHPNAAAFTVEGRLEDIRRDVIKTIGFYLK